MYLIYLDESGNTGLNLKDRQQPIFVLGAIAIHKSDWFRLENAFNEITRQFFSPAELENFELHAIDLKSGRNAFKNLTFQKQLEFRNSMIDLLVDNHIELIYQRIIKTKFASFCEKEYGKGIRVNPYIMALPFICMELESYLESKETDTLGMMIFDEQKENLNDVEKSLRTLRLDPDSLLQTNRIIEKGFFVDSSKSYALQLVDLVTYYIRKYEEHKLGIEVSPYDQQIFPKLKKLIWKKNKTNPSDIFEWVKKNHIKK